MAVGQARSETDWAEMRCFGGGMLAKLMCVVPEKITKSVLVVPYGINNAFPPDSARTMIPLIQ